MWGWSKTIERAWSWCLRRPEVAARKVVFGVLSRLHPELSRVEDEDERVRVSMVAGMRRQPPQWKTYLFVILVCVIFPAVGAILALLIAPRLGIGD